MQSFPCPSIQWKFNGTDINDTRLNDAVVNLTDISRTHKSPYIFTDACLDKALFNKFSFFLLLMDTLTMDISGYYWAVFDNGISSPVVSPPIFLTVPGKNCKYYIYPIAISI